MRLYQKSKFHKCNLQIVSSPSFHPSLPAAGRQTSPEGVALKSPSGDLGVLTVSLLSNCMFLKNIITFDTDSSLPNGDPETSSG